MAARTDTSMTIRMNREIKQEAQEIFAALDMDLKRIQKRGYDISLLTAII